MHASFSPRRHRVQGVTLIELMVGIVIVAILSSIAYPMYSEQVQKARRTDGKNALMDTAQRLERCYTRFGRYDAPNCNVVLPMNSPEAFYALSAVGAITPASFTLAATPQNAQVTDTKCGVLRLTNRGQQGSQNMATDANNCW